MAEYDTTVTIGVEESGLVVGMQRAAQAVQSGVQQIEGNFAQLTGIFGKVQTAMLAITAVLAGGATFKAAVEESMNLTREAVGLGKALGISATEASVLSVALGDIYQTSDTLQAALGKITKTLNTNEGAFRALGVATRDQDGHYRNSLDILLATNQALLKFREGTDRNVEGMKVFGKAWGEIAPLLKLNTKLIEESRKKAESLGLVVGEENVAAVAKYRAAMNDAGDVTKAMKKAIGDILLPQLTELANWLTKDGPEAVSAFKSAFKTTFETIGTIAVMTNRVIQTVCEEIAFAFEQLGRRVAVIALKLNPFASKEAYETGLKDLNDKLAEHKLLILKYAADEKAALELILGKESKNTPTQRPAGGAFALDEKTLVEMAKKHSELLKEKVKDYEALVGAIRKAFEQAIAEEEKYLDKAQALRDKATLKRTEGKDKVLDRQLKEADTEDPEGAEYGRQALARQALSDAETAQAQATLAGYQGNTKAAERYNAQVEEHVKRAEQLAGELKNVAVGNDLITKSSEIAATNLESQAAAEEKKASEAKAQQEGLRRELHDTEAAVAELQKVLDALGKPIKLAIDTEAAKAALDEILAKVSAIGQAVLDANKGSGPTAGPATPGRYTLDLAGSVPKFALPSLPQQAGGPMSQVVVNLPGGQAATLVAPQESAASFADQLQRYSTQWAGA